VAWLPLHPHTCPSGNYGDPITNTCVPCQAGYYTSASDVPCQKCPLRTYSSTVATTECTRCPGVVSADSTQCADCPPGTSVPMEIDYPKYVNQCIPCADRGPTFYSVKINSEYCSVCWFSQATPERTGCAPYVIVPTSPPTNGPTRQCNPGEVLKWSQLTYTPRDFYCERCNYGTYSQSPQVPCQKCPDGLVADNPAGSFECHPCPYGTVPIKGVYDVLDGSRCVTTIPTPVVT
jgi:hypothetical protein